MILTDVTKGAQGNDERLAFLYDPRRVKPSGRACELLLPGVEYTGGRRVRLRPPPDDQPEQVELSWRIFDHYPSWAEFLSH
jgi:hypothetical protein